MARTTSHFAPSAAAAALCCALTPAARAQDAPATGTVTSTVTIVGRSLASASVAGFGDAPLASAPLSASVYGAQQLADRGVRSVGELTLLDASLGDAYNAEGYWSIISSRGYTLDNRYNYRRDGLPINAETAIALDNKDRLEVLKGISGLQAGTSAPGGVVNLVTKRATGTMRNARLEARQGGALLAAVDLSERLGRDGRFGLRLNAAAEHLDPRVRNTRGERNLLALAADAQLSPDTQVQADVETSHQRQPSVVGFSLLGNSVPDPRKVDLLHNLNDQPWRQPVVFNGNTSSLRVQQRVNEAWKLVAQAMVQRLKTDDRTAFPFGVFDPETFDCPQYCDRFAPDGSFTYWQFISNNERRTTKALSLALNGRAHGAGIDHQLEAGVLVSRFKARFEDQVFDIAGTGHIDGTLVTPPSAGGTDANTDRDERNTELFVRDAMRLAADWQLWAGLRHTRVERESRRTRPADDGLRATDYSQSFNAPWLALSYNLAAHTWLYTSWGRGVESEVAPNRSRYTNAGESLPTLQSRQVEAGLKHEGEAFDASLALFDIQRPQSADSGPCDAAASCTRVIDGVARHRGVEATVALRQALVTWQASAMWLDAERQGALVDPGVNGQRPVNVPKATLRLGAEFRVPALPGLALISQMSAESKRQVLPNDPSLHIPGWARLDLGARWRQTLGSSTLVWRLALDNATNRKAWKESPYQFGHSYLYPLPARNWRASVQASF